MFLFPRLVAVVVAAIAGCWCWCCCVEAGFVTVFEKGKDGYACFRIPAIVQTRSGTLLAFAEGRKLSCADHGWNDLVMKRSTDNGTSWSALEVVHSESTPTHHVTIGNPAPVVDPGTGTIHMPYCRNNKQVFVLHSTDDAKTWSSPLNITSQVLDPTWSWYATGT